MPLTYPNAYPDPGALCSLKDGNMPSYPLKSRWRLNWTEDNVPELPGDYEKHKGQVVIVIGARGRGVERKYTVQSLSDGWRGIVLASQLEEIEDGTR